MTTLYAQPYDIYAAGFYFDTLEEYNEKSKNNRNNYGEIVEEYEIQFIDGEHIDCALFKALGIHQGNIGDYLQACDDWQEEEKQKVIIAVGECGYSFNFTTDTPDSFEVDISPVETLKELAEQFVDEGLFGDIPPSIASYLDYDTIARDLGVDYTETEIAGERLVYRCN